MDPTTQFKRLMALAKLRTEGLSPFLRELGYAPSNAITAVTGQRSPPGGLIKELGESLGFSEEDGFTDLRIEAWLARSVNDLESLVKEYDFDIQLLTRLITDREKQGKSHQYKFCLLYVGYAMSGRYVVLRMTYDKLDEFIARLHLNELKKVDWSLNAEKPNQKSVYDYATCLQPLMEVKLVLAERTERPAKVTASEVAALKKRVRASVEEILGKLTDFLKNPGPVQARRAKTPSLRTDGAERKLIDRDVVTMAESSHEIRREKLKNKPRTQLMGLTNAGTWVPLEIEVVYPGEDKERVDKPSDPSQHLIVMQMHRGGLVEIIFNGRKIDLYKATDTATDKEQGRDLLLKEEASLPHEARLIKVSAIRLHGEKVPHKDRLKIRD